MAMGQVGTKTLDQVFRAELRAIAERHNRIAGREKINEDMKPSAALGLTGLACSGGGIRSASFCLGVLQGLQSKNIIDRIDYLSTVSGGGYIGSTLSIGMSTGPDASSPDAKVANPGPKADGEAAQAEAANAEAAEAEAADGEAAKAEAAEAEAANAEAANVEAAKEEALFPFGRLAEEDRESPEVKHLRDNSRYLLQNGIPGLISAFVIYLRGLAMNTLVILPWLILAAAFLVLLNPTTQDLVDHGMLGKYLSPLVGTSRIPVTISGAVALAVLLVVYAILVSVLRIQPIGERRGGAKIAGWILFLILVASLVEFHAVLLRLVFEMEKLIKVPGEQASPGSVQVFEFLYRTAEKFVTFVWPLVLALLPFWKTLAAKASQETSGWQEGAKQLASRIVLILAAAIIPVLLWLVMMQLAFWGIAVSPCSLADNCKGPWAHAPALLQTLAAHAGGLGKFEMPMIYVLGALVLFAIWPFLSVNSNSLHQLYRDRLGRAFLIRRRNHKDDKDVDADLGDVISVDDFRLSQLNPARGPYHIINAALNVPGSRFANRRGRNADFFIFSKCFIGSEITGYIETEQAEKIVDGLNVGTAVAISGAAAAPNMGLASIRPLSATIAFMNVRLGRWLRHPHDIAHMHAKLSPQAKSGDNETGKNSEMGKGVPSGGLLAIRRVPGPKHLLYEAFFKSGRDVTQRREMSDKAEAKPSDESEEKLSDQSEVKASDKSRKMGFIFLTDGGHIENLGIYELLRRRCKLIIAIDGEADPRMEAPSLTQLERIARIDYNISLRMQWKPIGAITRAVASSTWRPSAHGPHVALGLIDYPPPPLGGARETGVLIYIKASLSGDENDYVLAYNARHASFPHESTADQLFSEEQFEVYRALGEHIAIGFVTGRDPVSVDSNNKQMLTDMVKDVLKIWDTPAP
jgi:hypothetical protein